MPKKDERSLAQKLFDSCIPEPNSGCWIWDGRFQKGAPKILVKRKVDKNARKISYSIHIGPLEGSDTAIVTCGNDLCVNPDHLTAKLAGTWCTDAAARRVDYVSPLKGMAKIEICQIHKLPYEEVVRKSGRIDRFCPECLSIKKKEWSVGRQRKFSKRICPVCEKSYTPRINGQERCSTECCAAWDAGVKKIRRLRPVIEATSRNEWHLADTRSYQRMCLKMHKLGYVIQNPKNKNEWKASEIGMSSRSILEKSA